MCRSVLLLPLQLFGLMAMLVAMPTCRLQGHLVRTTHNLLRDLGGPFPVHCLQHNANVSFPSSAFPATASNQNQCRQVLWFVYETLRGAKQLFNNHTLPEGEGGVSWDLEKFDYFQNLLDRLLKEGRCFSRFAVSDDLSSYFNTITSALQQGSSGCGWLALRRDLLWTLHSALQLQHGCFP